MLALPSPYSGLMGRLTTGLPDMVVSRCLIWHQAGVTDSSGPILEYMAACPECEQSSFDPLSHLIFKLDVITSIP
jgi:hypothetical protein